MKSLEDLDLVDTYPDTDIRLTIHGDKLAKKENFRIKKNI